MNHLGLFEGIGGFSLAARWANWETKGWVEINPFCQTVLKYHFPEAQGFGDIKKFSYAVYKSILRNRGIKDRSIDIVTGGFPCQPYSSAGLRKGTDDPRHLWPNMLETIRQFKPTWVVGENVRGITNWSGGLVFEQVQVDLEAIGYEVQAFVLPACAVNAPHRRDRVWFIAYRPNTRAESVRRKRENTIHEPGITPDTMPTQRERQRGGLESKFVAGGKCFDSYTYCPGLQIGFRPQWPGIQRPAESSKRCQPCGVHAAGGEWIFTYSDCFRRIQSDSKPESRQPAKEIPNWGQFPTQSPLCGRNDGLPTRLAGITFPRHRRESIQAYGNAIVPQVAYQIFQAINEHERATTKGSIYPGL